MIVALAGGVGGARLADGLAAVCAPGELIVVVNTGDDFTHLGLEISPDLDTVMYTLAGLADAERGWGLAGESWTTMEALARLGGETWFRLGDRDLATHIERTQRLRAGQTLSAITADFCRRLEIAQHIVPMSDDPVRTFVDTDIGRLAFQDYFVRRQCAPRVRSLCYQGGGDARPSPRLMAAFNSPRLDAVIVCPSNPYLSIDPMLAMPGVRAALTAAPAPVVAVSPIIGGAAVKGPAAKIMTELGVMPSADAVAAYYADFIDGFVLDECDAAKTGAIKANTFVTRTIMGDRPDRARLAEEVLGFARSLR